MTELNEDQRTLLTANLVWDLANHERAPSVLAEMGLTPPSPDGQRTECYVSHLREALVKPLEKELDFMSEKMAEIAVNVILGDTAERLGKDMTEMLVFQYETVINATLKAGLANLLASNKLMYKRS